MNNKGCLVALIALLLCPIPVYAATGTNPADAYLKAQFALRNQDFGAAEIFLREAIRLDNRNSHFWSELGRLFLHKGKPAKAVAPFRRAKRLDKENRHAYYGLGHAFRSLDRPGLARLQYENLLKFAPDETEALIYLADLYTRQGLRHQALKTYRQLLPAIPDNPVILYNYAVLLSQSGQRLGAREQLVRLGEITPDFLPARRLLIRLYREDENWEQATRLLLETRQVMPDDPWVLTSLVELYALQEEYRKAVEILEGSAFPPTPEIMRFQGFLYYHLKDYPRAVETLEESLTRREDPDTRFYLAVTLDRMNRQEEAIKHLRRILEEEPENHLALNNLGYTLVERGENLDEARRLIQRALRMEPGNGAYLDSLGWLYFKEGNLRFARYYLVKAARYEQDPEIYGHLEKLYEALGDENRAEYYRLKKEALTAEDEEAD